MARFGDSPEVFGHVDFEFHPFSYDRENEEFNIAGETVALESSGIESRLIFPRSDGWPHEYLYRSPVWMAYGSVLATPRFNQWLRESCDDEVLLETKLVMKDVFEKLKDVKIDGEPSQSRLTSAFGFEANFIRPGHINLQTIGNCACLGTDPDGHIVDYTEWDTGYVEYVMHNADWTEQRVSLLAGIGHLAQLASQS